MADEPKVTNHIDAKALTPRRHWLAHNSRTVIFLIIVVALVGGYQALNIPIAVFPSTDFPHHAPGGAGRQQRAGTGDGALHYQPRLGGSRLVL